MKLIIALDNIRSLHNVGSIARSAYGFEVDEIVTIGITPHMKQANDDRLPHVYEKAEKAISKTALGGEVLLTEHFSDSDGFLNWLKHNEYAAVSLELTDSASDVRDFSPTSDTVLVLGNEVDGVSQEILDASQHIQIPISERKESYNVSNAAAIAMYAIHDQFGKLSS